MGVVQHLFIGPYAEFAVPPGRADEFPPNDEYDDRGRPVEKGNMYSNLGMDDPHTDCYRHMPCGDLPGRGRAMYFSGKGGPGLEDQDLTDLDRRAEIEWFESAYAKQLRRLADAYGGPPRIRWGIVSWLS